MWRKRKNRKNLKYLKYLGIVFLLLGILLILTSVYIFVSPYVLKNPLVSPLPKNIKTYNGDIRSILEKEKIKFSKVSIATDSSYMVFLSDGGVAILSSRKNITDQVRSLQIILTRLTIEGKKLKNLDFRFDKPVVSF